MTLANAAAPEGMLPRMDHPSAPAIAPPTSAAGAVLAEDRACVQCGYNLRGLPYAGKCPECGIPVQDSLRGILLQFASSEYLAKLNQGLSLVLNGILLMIILNVLSFFVGATGAGGSQIVLAIAGLQLLPSIMILLGYWKYTEPDPGFVGTELPGAARKIMRITVVVQAICTALGFVVQIVLLSSVTAGVATPGNNAAIAIGGLVLLVSLASIAAWGVQFFATMKYTGWIATRVPDALIMKRARTYMWLLPLIGIVGIIVIIGPLIALVLYWNLLDRLRKHVKSIRGTGAPAALKGALG
jgi:hypothetical protein